MEEISKLLRSQGEFSSCSSPEPESSPCKAGHQITDTPVVTLEQVVGEEGNIFINIEQIDEKPIL